MQEERTLNYYKEYTILKPDGSVKAVFSELDRITTPGGCDAELYRVLLKKSDTYGRWAVIDKSGDYVTPVKYRQIGSRIRKAGDSFVIFVRDEDNLENAITLDGREIFAHGYPSVCSRSVGSGKICLLSEKVNGHVFYGLGDLETGKVILKPTWPLIMETENEDLFIISHQFNTPVYGDWGLMNQHGDVLFEPQFIGYASGRRWTDFNVLCTVSDPENEGFRYYIVDFFGKKLYEAWSIDPFERLNAASLSMAMNAFIFYTDLGNWHRKGRAKLVVACGRDEKNRVYECDFRFGHRCTSEDFYRLALRAAKKAGIDTKIYTVRSL